jgi:hypothetical protein
VARWGPLGGLGVAATGLACPCHVLSGAALAVVAAVTGSAPAFEPSPAAQDAVHAVYVPLAVALGAALLARGRRGPQRPPRIAGVPRRPAPAE